ncbi:MAG: hypothetical protein N2559_00915 [Anaerolineae bacterium]|nr:hypothetical protein [Anaerolineae bacterium]
MSDKHLTFDEWEQLNENELDSARRAQMEQHLNDCALCRAQAEYHQRLDLMLRALPRVSVPADLVARIEARVAHEQGRRARLPFIVLAMLLSLLVALWFCIELGIALQENGILDFWTLLNSYSDQFSAELVIALLEAIPLTETLLTLCAFLTVGVFAQQLVETLRPRPIGLSMVTNKHSSNS